MANYTPRYEFNPLVPEFWAPFLQVPLYKSLVASEVANTRLEPYLKKGDVFNHSYIAMPEVQDYTPYQDIEYFHVVDAIPEQLVVDQVKVSPIIVDRIEELQTNINLVSELGERAGYQLKDIIDAHVLGETVNGTPFTFSDAVNKGNIIDFFAAAKTELRKQNVEENGDWIAVVTPDIAQLIELAAFGNTFAMADSYFKNGYGGNFMGLSVYISNNLPTVSDGSCIYIGRRGMIDLVMQSAPSMAISDVENGLGKKFKPFTVFGSKVFHENAKRFLCATYTLGISS